MRKLLLVLTCCTVAASARADGMLDPAFGNGGIAIVGVAISDSMAGMVLTPGGEIVAAGTSLSLPPNIFAAMIAARLLPSGTPDPTFGFDGRVLVEFPGPGDAFGLGLAVQSDGKPVITGGFTATGGVVSQVAVIRLATNGALDPSFGSGGRVLLGCPGGECRGSGVALQSDGKIVALVRDDGAGGRLLRLLPDGALDPSFGTAGVAAIPPVWNFLAWEVAVHDGRIVVGGTVAPSTGVDDFAAARFLADGTPDPAFGGDGLAVWVVPGAQVGGRLAVQESGAVIVGGSHLLGVGATFAMARFLADGTPDAGFGAGGLASGGPGSAAAILELPNGTLMQAGTIPGPLGSTPDVALVRYLSGGTLDPTFGAAGIFKIDFGGQDFVGGLAYAGPERLLLGGSSEILGGPNQDDFAFARIIATTPVALQTFAIE